MPEVPGVLVLKVPVVLVPKVPVVLVPKVPEVLVPEVRVRRCWRCRRCWQRLRFTLRNRTRQKADLIPTISRTRAEPSSSGAGRIVPWIVVRGSADMTSEGLRISTTSRGADTVPPLT